MTFAEYLAAHVRGDFLLLPLLPSTAVSFASPGKDDTKRAIDRARKLGRPVTPADLKLATSPESQEAARQGVLDVSRPPLGRTSGKTSATAGS